MHPPELYPPDLQDWLRLSLTPGVGTAAARRLLAAFGLPSRIFAQGRAALQQHVSSAQATALLTEPEGFAQALARACQWLQTPALPTETDKGTGTGLAAGLAAETGAAPRPPAPARAVLVLGDPRYPRLLLETEDPPTLLYAMGPLRFLQPGACPFPERTCLAVVGSRNPSAQGAQNAHQFAQALRAAGLTVVSGLALGVDAAAHEGALQEGELQPDSPTPVTIAVVGTGLDRVYPRRHLALAHRIAACGLLVSEYPLGTPPLPANFPKRNRIIAGLSQGTLVVEAAPASGSLITARLASEQGREVFAIPGSIHAPQSRGCHALIRQGAKLVESVQDVLEELQLPGALAAPPGTAVDTGMGTAKAAQRSRAEPPRQAATPPRTPGSNRPRPAATPAHGPQAGHAADTGTGEGTATGSANGAAGPGEDCALLQALGHDPAGLDALQARTGLDTATLQVQLLQLELDGQVARLPGGLFQRIGSA